MKYLPLILLLSCVKPDIDHLYQIKAGNHRSATAPIPHAGNSITFEFTVNSTWLQPSDPSGVNKLCGFSYGPHHDNSVRLGWQYVDDLILAYAYTYVEGVSFYEVIDTLQVDETYLFEIYRNGDYYNFIWNDSKYSTPASGWLPGNVLLPYIGGEGTFKEDWYVDMIIY